MRIRSKRWKLFWILMCTFQMVIWVRSERDTRQEGTKGVIFPRMDYNQWKPLGHGDPLKDDPTFDYVPPVLDHVHYWEQTTEEGGTSNLPINQTMLQALNKTENKKEILLLGVSSKKPAVQVADKRTDNNFDSYHKYTNTYSSFNTYHDGLKYNTKYHDNQRIARPSFFPSTSSVLPSLMNFASKIFDRSPHSKESELKEPDTMLVPPPMTSNQPSGPTAPAPLITQHPLFYATSIDPDHENYVTSTPSVTIEESNLVYQSSSLSNPHEFGTHTSFHSSVPSIREQLPATIKYNNFQSQPPSLGTVPVEEHNFNYNSQKLLLPDSYMKIKFSSYNNLNNRLLDGAGSNVKINYVTPPPMHKLNFVTPAPLPSQNKPVKYKGHVSDDHEITNTYVKIEKPQAQMHSTAEGIDNMPLNSGLLYSDIITSPDINMQTIKDMQTLQPPAPQSLGDSLVQNPIFIETGKPLISILKKEQITENFHDFDKTNFIASESMVTNTVTAHPLNVETSTTKMQSSDSTTETITTTSTTTTTQSPITTTVGTLTTDPLFKHYKQPLEHIKDGPLYLIIQGHSKVKTYKPAKQIDGIMIQETNEIPNSDSEHLDFDVKHLHHILKMTPNDYSRQARSRNNGNLQTLKHIAQTGYGKIDFESEVFTESLDKNTPSSIEKVLSTMQPINYNVNYNLHRMIKEVKGVPKEVFDALKDLKDGKTDFKHVGELLIQSVSQNENAIETSTKEMNPDEDQPGIQAENIQETELKTRFEVGNIDDTTSEKYHKGIVEAARKLKL